VWERVGGISVGAYRPFSCWKHTCGSVQTFFVLEAYAWERTDLFRVGGVQTFFVLEAYVMGAYRPSFVLEAYIPFSRWKRTWF
jgi:hypothetical protein